MDHLTTNQVNSKASQAVSQLLEAFKALDIQFEDREGNECRGRIHVDLRDASVHRRVKTFLMELEATAYAFELPMVSRKYRHTFTHNYRALMPPDKRVYRVDVLEAGQEGQNMLWVNGTRYVLPDHVVLSNCKFQTSWAALLLHLRRVCEEVERNKTQGINTHLNQVNWVIRLGVPLIKFDLCWTQFERHYIDALMAIEKEARSVLTDCLYMNEELSHYEELYRRIALALDTRPSEASSIALRSLSNTIKQCYSAFIAQLAQLNPRANTQRKGRSDFQFFTLDTAAHILCVAERHKCINASSSILFKYPWTNVEMCTSDEHEAHWTNHADFYTLELLRPLAEPLLTGLQAIRDVMTNMSLCPERIDPHLAQNHLLAESLAQFEAQWDDAWAYLNDQETLDCLTSFLLFLHQVVELDTRNLLEHHKDPQSSVAAPGPPCNDTLEERIAALDVSAFLTLSRLAALFFVSSFSTPSSVGQFPQRVNTNLLKMLLPETFADLMASSKNTSTELPKSLNGDPPSDLSQTLSVPCDNVSCPTPREPSLPLSFTLSSSSGLNDVVLHQVPIALQPVLRWGVHISMLCWTSPQPLHDTHTTSLETRVFMYILKSCVTYREDVNHTFLDDAVAHVHGLRDAVLRFLNALEQSSIILQRTNPREWNAFLQTTFKCLVVFRSTLRLPCSPRSPDPIKTDPVKLLVTSLSPTKSPNLALLPRCSITSSESSNSPDHPSFTQHPSSLKQNRWVEGSATPPESSHPCSRCPPHFPSFPGFSHL